MKKKTTTKSTKWERVIEWRTPKSSVLLYDLLWKDACRVAAAMARPQLKYDKYNGREKKKYIFIYREKININFDRKKGGEEKEGNLWVIVSQIGSVHGSEYPVRTYSMRRGVDMKATPVSGTGPPLSLLLFPRSHSPCRASLRAARVKPPSLFPPLSGSSMWWNGYRAS